VNKLIVFFARLSLGSTIILSLIREFVTGLGVEIGLKLLKRRRGPAISKTIKSYPKPPKPTFSNQGTYLPNGFLWYLPYTHLAIKSSA
jgi:hypothetical protein